VADQAPIVRTYPVNSQIWSVVSGPPNGGIPFGLPSRMERKIDT
jgi:hypothetical protein